MLNSSPASPQAEDPGGGFETHEPSFDAPGVPGGPAQYQIVVAGGKGGVGKTTIATNLAIVLAESGENVTYLDCDVEEPNGHLFLHPVIESSQPITTSVPVVDQDTCTLCGKCAEICQFGAIICLGTRVMTFPDLCHGCGGCKLACEAGAIQEAPKEIGVVEEGFADEVRFVQGKLNVAYPMSSLLIREAKQRLRTPGVHIVDSPAGVSCSAVQSLAGANYVLVVAESTPFGLYDLQLSVDMLRIMRLPFGVVINRADIGVTEVSQYCDTEGIEVLLVIPNDRRVADAYSHGMLASHVIGSYAHWMLDLFRKADRRLVR